ncbi:MAG: crossover junction endodeoxyribonuclease RuvC [Rickettsiaceae bacterium]|nr:crossover junction endodeoxyribonuclease RuvC [Rickettsiaceae bacterium]
MKILGIDPALVSLGWGIITDEASKIKYIDSGLIKTSSEQQIHKRLAFIVSSIENIINLHQPDIFAMEETFVNKNANSSLKLGFARGAVMSLIGKHDLPFYEYKPNLIKKTVVGTGHAEKEQLQHMIQIILSGLKKQVSLDETDALAAAYTCYVLNSNNSH